MMMRFPILPSIQQRVGIISPKQTAAVLLLLVLASDCAAEPAPHGLPLVPPGTVAVAPTAARFNRVVYLAASRIASGDADAVPAVIASRVPLFTLALLATVGQIENAEGQPLHRLLEVGAGYAVPLAGQLTVIDPAAPPTAAGIDMIGRQVLAANGRHLAELRRAGANGTIQVIDVDSLFLRGGHHTPLVMRHFIWVEPTSGRCSSCVWLLARAADGHFEPTADPPRWLQEGTRDDRAIHVDAGEFFLGMPTKDAFALTDLPPGTDLTWSAELRQAAVATHYLEPELNRLAAAINQALQPLRDSAE